MERLGVLMPDSYWYSLVFTWEQLLQCVNWLGWGLSYTCRIFRGNSFENLGKSKKEGG